MEIVEKLREISRNGTFSFKYNWISLSQGNVSEALSEFQKGTTVSARISENDIISAIREICEKNKISNEFITKAFVYRAQTKVGLKTPASGYWTNIVFLYYVPSSKDWYMYGYAKGRFVRPFLGLNREQSSGYALYFSINEKQRNISSSIPRTK